MDNGSRGALSHAHGAMETEHLLAIPFLLIDDLFGRFASPNPEPASSSSFRPLPFQDCATSSKGRFDGRYPIRIDVEWRLTIQRGLGVRSSSFVPLSMPSA